MAGQMPLHVRRLFGVYESPRRTHEVSGQTFGVAGDTLNQRTRITDAKHRSTDVVFDDGDRVIRQTLPDGASVSFVYDSLGRRTEATDAVMSTFRV